jgi:F0F1-type ATP synthase assembly protein I
MADRLPDPGEIRRLFALALVGVEMVAPILVGLYLDRTFGWAPWGVAVGAVLGLVGGIYHLIVQANRIDRERSKKSKDSP